MTEWMDRNIPMWEMLAHLVVSVVIVAPVMVVLGDGWWKWPTYVVAMGAGVPFMRRYFGRR